MTEHSTDADGAPSPVDMHVGQRLRALRRAQGVTQEQLASSLGITFQQVQKYEKGTNRVSASKLYAAAQLLRVKVSAFFDGLPEAEPAEGADQVLVQALANDPALVDSISALLRLSRHRRRIVQDSIAALADGS